ncbi:MAG: endonuclease/exonuclease/phosphatase family protein [Eubacteriales bacterium]
MQVQVMTFNIRYDTKDDGINCFDGRKALVKAFLDREKPDVIGFQEVVPHVRAWLCENLPDYTVLGMGRNADYSGESVSIAFRKDKFDLVEFHQFWLSDTPDVPGSRYLLDQSGCPRISVQASLVSRAEGKVFTFANTHLDHVGKYAQVCGASLLMNKLLSGQKYPFVLTGDFNATPKQEAIRAIKAIKGVRDLTAGVKGTTYHGYGKVDNAKIDYIFSNRPAVKDSLTVHKDCENGIWISDHYPISVTVDF